MRKCSFLVGVALVGLFGVSTAFAQTAPVASDEGGSGEIIVTAQKRSEALIDVPASISALRGTELLSQGQTSYADYAAFVPGMAIVRTGPGAGQIVLRGLNTGNDVSATTGIVVDGIPVGLSGSYGNGGKTAFDLDPADIERVEVLKGPQGTLYGAASMGGLLSYVTRRPSLTDMQASVNAELSTTHEGGENGAVRASIGMPIVTDMVGLRVSGLYEKRAGFIDDDQLGLKNINSSERYGMRGSLLVQPSADLSMLLAATYQKQTLDSTQNVVYNAVTGSPLNGDLQFDRGVLQPISDRFLQFSGNTNWDFGAANLTWLASYTESRNAQTYDFTTSGLGRTIITAGTQGLGPVVPSALVGVDAVTELKKHTQELRLASSGDGPFQWLVGVFYTREVLHVDQPIYGIDADGTIRAGLDKLVYFHQEPRFREIAGYLNASYKILPRVELSGGVRVSKINQRFQLLTTGPSVAGLNTLLGTGFAADSGVSHEKDDVATYSAGIKYSLTEDGIIYARFATGYRPGGPNVIVAGAPATYQSDTVNNFEVGAKLALFDRKLRIDLSAYRIDWKDIQIASSVRGVTLRDNGGKARSQGVEFSGTLAPVDGLKVGVTLAYTDAKLLEPVAALYARKGDRLPSVAKWSGSFFVDVERPVGPDQTIFFNTALQYNGNRNSSFPLSVVRPNIALDDYAMVDIRVGLRLGKTEISAFVKNLTDERAELSGNYSSGFGEVTIATPRTIGISLGWTY